MARKKGTIHEPPYGGNSFRPQWSLSLSHCPNLVIVVEYWKVNQLVSFTSQLLPTCLRHTADRSQEETSGSLMIITANVKAWMSVVEELLRWYLWPRLDIWNTWWRMRSYSGSWQLWDVSHYTKKKRPKDKAATEALLRHSCPGGVIKCF